MRARITWAALGLLLAAGAGVLGPACDETAARPNVLLITIDTLRADHLGCYGYGRPTSPEIDRLAAQGVVFEAAQSSSSWTLPSLASIHTALLSTTHGCWKIESRLEPEYTTLAETLRDAGWDTAMVACHIFLSAQYGLQQGFTHVDDALVRPPADAAQAISSPGVSQRGIRFLGQQAAAGADAPWFLWLHYFDPHDEYLPHAGFSERFGTEREIDLYDGEIAFTDHHVGRVLRRLEELGLAENTVIVLTSDHGEEFGEHGHMRHGYTLYEPAVRIPLIVRAPGLAARRVPDVVSNVDILPTVLGLCGVRYERAPGAKCAHPLQGRTLDPLLRGAPDAAREAVSEVRWHDGQDMRALRAGDWKYLEHRVRGVDQDLLFDLAADPGEAHDALAREAAHTARLREALLHQVGRALQWSGCYPLHEPYSPSPGDLERLKALGYTGDELPALPPGSPREER